VETVESQRHKDCICLGELLLDTQAGWFLRLDCASMSECPQFGMPAERHAQFQVPNMPRSRISERAPVQIYEHTQCRVFERTSLQHTYVIPCRKWGRMLCYGHDAARGNAPPLRPIWTIMVKAKLDHSRVLVTKFHQNRSTLKGRSETHRQTDRQTRLKIRALQVLQ